MYKKIPKLFYIVLTALFLLFGACNIVAAGITEEIKEYIDGIESIAVEFSQSDQHGQHAKGMLIIDKPYRFRCNYYKPFPLVIIGNRNYVSVYDYDMEHISRINAESNIFYFLLVNDIDFDNKFKILSTKSTEAQYYVKLKSTEIDKISEITFNKNTKNIKQMKIYEDDNVITIDFGYTQKIRDVVNSLFIIQNPNVFGPPPRLTKEQLLRMFTVVSVSS